MLIMKKILYAVKRYKQWKTIPSHRQRPIISYDLAIFLDQFV